MNTQHKLRELLARVKTIRCDHSVSYSAIVQWRSNDPERQIKRIMADKVAHEIAGEVMRVGTWSKTRGPDGEVFSVRGIWMDYDSLYRLVEDAYSMGRTEPVAMFIPETAPQKAEQEPVQPPDWVGLTNKDIDDCYFAARQPDFDIWAFAAEIEEVLKQKNAWGNHLV